MQTSNSIVNISSALLKAQKNIEGATKGSANPFFRSKYADLNSVMDACKQHLNEQGISVLQPVQSDEHGDYVETTLLHESGEWITSRMKLMVNKQNMQELGSAVSYARRYALQSLVFVGANDDDGEAAVASSRTTTQAKATGTTGKATGGFKPTIAKPIATTNTVGEADGFDD